MNKYIFLTVLALGTICSSTSLADDTLDFLLKKSKNYDDIKVKAVLQSDVIRLENEEVIRLIGVKSKSYKVKKKQTRRDKHNMVIVEKVSPFTPIEERSYFYVKELLEGQKVRLEFDIQKRDDKFRTYAYVFRNKDGLFVNEDLLSKGLVYPQFRPPNKKYEQELRNAHREAFKEKLGLQGE